MKYELPKRTDDRFNLELRSDKPFDVAGLGMNSADHLCLVPRYPQFDTKTEICRFEKLPGGQVATAMAFLSRLGAKVKYIGKVGSDDLGQMVLADLRKEGIELSAVSVAEGVSNQCAFIIIDQSTGERTILWKRDPRLNFEPGDFCKGDVTCARILYLDGHDGDAALLAAGWAAEESIPVVIDLDKAVPECTKLVAKVDFLICSSNIPAELTGCNATEGALLAMRRLCGGFIAVTLGGAGAMAVVGDECVRFPGYPITPVDTTGAGDAFHAGFVYGLLRNWPLNDIMSFANAAAALNCREIGAKAGLPTLEEVLRLARASGC